MTCRQSTVQKQEGSSRRGGEDGGRVRRRSDFLVQDTGLATEPRIRCDKTSRGLANGAPKLLIFNFFSSEMSEILKESDILH